MLRKKAGIPVLVFCLIFVLLTWLLYREFWKDVRVDVRESVNAGMRRRIATRRIPHTKRSQPARERPSIPYDRRTKIA